MKFFYMVITHPSEFITILTLSPVRHFFTMFAKFTGTTTVALAALHVIHGGVTAAAVVNCMFIFAAAHPNESPPIFMSQ